jgi:hypothetical protein
MKAKKMLVVCGFSGFLGLICVLVVLANVSCAVPVENQFPGAAQFKAASTAIAQAMQSYHSPRYGIPGRREGAGTR